MIGYPTKTRVHSPTSNTLKSYNTVGRGMTLESEIIASNEYYLAINRAVIHKKPTPIQVVRVDYPNRAHAKIVEAYYKIPSTTDFNGIYRGKYIDFEAKETKNKTVFPFQLIHPHQIEHLDKVCQHGGIGFILLRFTSHNETYLIDAPFMIQAYRDPKLKSLTYQKIKENGTLVPEGFTPRLHYLDIVDEIYFTEVQYGKENKK